MGDAVNINTRVTPVSLSDSHRSTEQDVSSPELVGHSQKVAVPQKLCGVYQPHHDLRSKPLTTIPRESAAQLVRARTAYWVNHRSAVQMKPRSCYKLHDQSACMGPHVTERVAEVSHHHQTLLSAWKPRLSERKAE